MASLIRRDNDGNVTMHLTNKLNFKRDSFVRIKISVASSASTYELVLDPSEWEDILIQYYEHITLFVLS